jgi:hypothetical protein
VSSPRYIVHLIAVVSSDREQAQIQSLLLNTIPRSSAKRLLAQSSSSSSSSSVSGGGLDTRRILFCQSGEGMFYFN